MKTEIFGLGIDTYSICQNCVMDSSDPDITYDDLGICNHCRNYTQHVNVRSFQGDVGYRELDRLAAKIKQKGRDKDFDCIIGVSGGVDSTYVAWLVKDLGLRPLAVHFDNGWNSELAVSNIEKVLDRLNIDLYTYVIDWNDFKDLQLSFLKSDTPDGEIPTDHAINALLFREASKRGIKYIINGMNYRTESTKVEKWSYGHSDWKYIKSIHKLYGTRRLKDYPHFSLQRAFRYLFIQRIRVVSILNYVDYDKATVMKFLEEELGWLYYGGKHYESIYTRFYQSYFLPTKFNIDKRKAHLSNLIRSGQLTREAALAELETPTIEREILLKDLEFVRKKLGLTVQELDSILRAEPKYFLSYPNNYLLVNGAKKLLNFMRSRKLMSR